MFPGNHTVQYVYSIGLNKKVGYIVSYSACFVGIRMNELYDFLYSICGLLLCEWAFFACFCLLYQVTIIPLATKILLELQYGLVWITGGMWWEFVLCMQCSLYQVVMCEGSDVHISD